MIYYSDILADMCSGPGVPHRIRSWQKQEAGKVDEEKRKKGELYLCQNLVTFTWQGGND
jgi:hypothetical protein